MYHVAFQSPDSNFATGLMFENVGLVKYQHLPVIGARSEPNIWNQDQTTNRIRMSIEIAHEFMLYPMLDCLVSRAYSG